MIGWRAFVCLVPLAAGAVAVAPVSRALAETTQDVCVDVRIGQEPFYSCLNRKLEEMVPNRRESSADAPITASSPAPAVGTFNQAATRQQLGTSFGHSIVPQRPPPPVFYNPLLNHIAR